MCKVLNYSLVRDREIQVCVSAFCSERETEIEIFYFVGGEVGGAVGGAVGGGRGVAW